LQVVRDILAGEITIQWVALTLLGGALNRLSVLITWNTAIYYTQWYNPIILIVIAIVWNFFFPVGYSVVTSLFLYNMGEKRIVSPGWIQVLTIALILSFASNLDISSLQYTIMGVLLLGIGGLIQDSIIIRILGVAGTEQDSLSLKLEANGTLDEVVKVLDQPTLMAIGITVKKNLRKHNTIVCRSPDYIPIRLMLFMRSSSVGPRKTLLHLVAYLRKRYRIMRDKLVDRTVEATVAGLREYLKEAGISLAEYDGIEGEDWFTATRKIALSPTKIPLGRLAKLPTRTLAIVLVLVVCVVSSYLLYVLKFLSIESWVNVGLSILLTIAALIPYLKGRRR